MSIDQPVNGVVDRSANDYVLSSVVGMSHPEFLRSMFSLFSMTEPEVSAQWEKKELQELGGSRPRDD